METYDRLVEKWAPVLNEESAGTIKDSHKRAVTAVVLENQESASKTSCAITMLQRLRQVTQLSSAANWNPVLISLVRRAMPNMMAYDVCGVQPMTGPTGLIFAMKARYGAGATGSTEALFNEAKQLLHGDSSVTKYSNLLVLLVNDALLVTQLVTLHLTRRVTAGYCWRYVNC